MAARWAAVDHFRLHIVYHGKQLHQLQFKKCREAGVNAMTFGGTSSPPRAPKTVGNGRPKGKEEFQSFFFLFTFVFFLNSFLFIEQSSGNGAFVLYKAIRRILAHYFGLCHSVLSFTFS